MEKKIIQQLIELNTDFYKKVEKDFDTTRQYPWSGWKRVGELIKNEFGNNPINYLDLACGNGRFAYFLKTNLFPMKYYLGLDNSEFLLEKAKELKLGDNYEFIYSDLLADTLPEQKFDIIVSFGFMHHVPSESLRIEFLNKFIRSLNPGGLLIVTFWSRFNKKSFKSESDLSARAKDLFPFLEKGDHFLGWDNMPNLERYCHLFEKEEIESMLPKLENCEVVDLYRSDGKAYPDNFYLVLKKS